MKQMIIMITAITAGAGAAVLLISRSARKKRNRPMTFSELYEDNRCADLGLLI